MFVGRTALSLDIRTKLSTLFLYELSFYPYLIVLAIGGDELDGCITPNLIATSV